MAGRNAGSRFALNPQVDISRSAFDRSSSVKFSFNVGELVPFYVEEVLPGDTFSVDTSKVVRLQTLLTPIMDNLYFDTYYFFVPNRLVWSHWKQFMGENTESAWYPSTEYTIPQLKAPSGGWQIGTIADAMGIPTGVDGLSVNALPFRAYALICDQWFRDQNLLDPLLVPLDDSDVSGTNGDNYIEDCAKGGKPFKAAKYHDYFTSCLPAPQKGPAVTIPVATGGEFPVYALPKTVPAAADYTDLYPLVSSAALNSGDRKVRAAGNNFVDGSKSWPVGTTDISDLPKLTNSDKNSSPINLWAQDINPQAASINQLRLAFQIQKLLERDARGGTRYQELLVSHFGVSAPDSRVQIPEYLGGNRIPITINQVLQTSGTQPDAGTPQGTPTGQSLTTDVNSDFTKSFVEHGFVIGVCVARYEHTYQQGIDRLFSRKTRFDYYWPSLANIGEQAVLNKEIYAQGTAEDDEVFGYQEAWAEYRYKPNRVFGEMRSSAPQSLDVWHLADDYESLPALSREWITEDKTTVDRVLAVQSRVSNQLFADIYVKCKAVRPMPLYSVPGLIDHN